MIESVNHTLTTIDGARRAMNLNKGWAFVKNRISRNRSIFRDQIPHEVVDLPHCWNAKDTFQEKVAYYQGECLYQKHFVVPREVFDGNDACWMLESEGFYGTGDIEINGYDLGEFDGQYLGFSLEVGEYLLFGSENVISIHLTNKCRSHVLPGIGDPDFLLHGGLAGRIRLVKKSTLHVDLNRTQIIAGKVSSAESVAVVKFTVVNCSGSARECEAMWSITDSSGKKVAEVSSGDISAPANGTGGVPPMRMTVCGAQLWSPDNPGLYRAECELRENGQVIDSVSLRFGFREAVFKPNEGFFLNGERVDLHGCNRHESVPGFGNAMPESLHREDALLLKKLGCNFARLSHYPQHPAFLDACDELGIMVYAEIATWKSVRTGHWLDSACRQMRDMIRRDRHHPSIILWGMGNESRSRKAYLALRDIVEREDGTRPVAYAENHLYRARRERTLDISDVWGCNYELDKLEAGRDSSRLKCVIVSEISNYPPAVRGDLVEEAKQVELIEQDLARLAGKPYVAGFALWCFSDYATMRKKRYNRHCGIVDAWRVPKMAAALFQAMYGKEPFVKVFGEWGIGSDERGVINDECRRSDGKLEGVLPKAFSIHCPVGEAADPPTFSQELDLLTGGTAASRSVHRFGQDALKTENAKLEKQPESADYRLQTTDHPPPTTNNMRSIHIFTNCEQIVLLRNGKELCRLAGKPHIVQSVEFEPGDLMVVGTKNGKQATDRLVSFGVARKIEVQPEKREYRAGETVAFTVRVLDDAGNVVGNWNGDVNAKLTGPAILKCYSPHNVISIRAGVGRGFVACADNAAVVSITVSFGDLEPGRCELAAVPSKDGML